MTSVREIKQAIHQLSPSGLAAFRQWFLRFDSGVWDHQFEQDAAGGKLDELGDEAVSVVKRVRI